MNHPWIDKKTPMIIGHRGASVHAPENTMPAFLLARNVGAHAIEFDVKLCADEQVIVIHDQTIDRTTNGRGDVRSMKLSALKEYDAGLKFGDKFRGTRIPTLLEVFEAVGSKLLMNIELTNYSTPNDNLVALVVELVRRTGVEKQVLFSSFYPRNLQIAARLIPEIPRALLTWPGILGWWGRSFQSGQGLYNAIHPNIKDTSLRLIDKCHLMQKRINVWTVNQLDDIRNLVAWGVDGIITDDPALALEGAGGKIE